MSRVNRSAFSIQGDALYNGQGPARHEVQPMLNPVHGGQFGWSPNLGEWVGKQGHVRRNIVPVLLKAPKFFEKMPDQLVWYKTLRSIIELHPESIDGLQGHLEVTTDEHPVGGAGEMFEEITDVKRARSVPVFNYTDTYGMGISTFFQQWIEYGMMNPETKTAMVGTISNYPTDMLADMYAMTCLFFEPDPTHRRVVNAWVITNMYPKGNGEILGKRDLANPLEVQKLSVEFTGIAQFNVGTKVFAQKVLNKINITNANPWVKPSFVDEANIDQTVAKKTRGYKEGIDDLAKSALTNPTGTV